MTKRRLKKLLIRWSFIIVVFSTLLYGHKTVIRYGYKAYRYIQQNRNQRNLVNHVNFPQAYSVHGIDISRYQPDLDWSTLKAVDVDNDTVQFQFVMIKATEGLFWEDPTFEDNWNDARKYKVIRGAYHYFKPSASAKLQAKNFINSVDLKSGDLPPVVDIEEMGKSNKKELVTSLKTFISLIEKEYGVKPIIYSNINFIEDYLADDFSNYKFWVAHFYVDDLKISSGIKWLFWQHHDKAHLLHSSANYDVNVFNGSSSDLKKILVR
ncbi:MAG: GH25 family lysozyme [Bacteroidia bacterium]